MFRKPGSPGDGKKPSHQQIEEATNNGKKYGGGRSGGKGSRLCEASCGRGLRKPENTLLSSKNLHSARKLRVPATSLPSLPLTMGASSHLLPAQNLFSNLKKNRDPLPQSYFSAPDLFLTSPGAANSFSATAKVGQWPLATD